jgi:putative DNA primase/helicase
MRADPFAPLDGAQPSATKPKAWSIVAPIPSDAPKPPAEHFKLGKPCARWNYTSPSGDVLGFVLRFDTKAGKEFRTITCWRSDAGVLQWKWESWPSKRPLYALAELAERPSAPVVVCEGEKAADAAARLLPGFVAVTSPNGGKSANKADWSALRGRSVVIWPDSDAAGLAYADAVAKLVGAAGARSVAIVTPPEGVTVGWDAADAESEGLTPERTANLIAAARTIEPGNGRTAKKAADVAADAGRRRRVPQRDLLVGVADEAELWHDAERTAYGTIGVNSHRENWPVRGRDFRMWLSGRFYEETGSAIGSQALEDGIRILEARAVNEGPQYAPAIRVGRGGDRLYLDLCDKRWRAVEITTVGWDIIDKPPVKFLRSGSMRPLPEPERGGMIEQLRRFVNVSDDEFILTVAWLIAALRDRGPYPVLAINGEQGTGKSVVSRMLRSLIDPAAAPIRATPKDDRDLVVSASNSLILAYDNLSSVAPWLADGLCRLSTGSGFATRMLHTDRVEVVFDASRPLLLNGIPSLTDRADLADRSLHLRLQTIAEEARDCEEDLLAAFEAQRPAILGALLDAVSGALRNFHAVKIERAPRMADFARWVTAAERSLGWKDGQFLEVYRANRREVIETSFEADATAVAIKDYVLAEHPQGWTGTATDLLAALNNRVSESIRRSKLWPLNAQSLGNRIDRIAPLLRNKGFTIERRHSGQRHIIVVPPAAESAA